MRLSVYAERLCTFLCVSVFTSDLVSVGMYMCLCVHVSVCVPGSACILVYVWVCLCVHLLPGGLEFPTGQCLIMQGLCPSRTLNVANRGKNFSLHYCQLILSLCLCLFCLFMIHHIQK
jgi:hypothetical protein